MDIHIEKKEPMIIGNKTFRSADGFNLTEFDIEIAHREINETEERKIECIAKLKEKLSSKAYFISFY